MMTRKKWGMVRSKTRGTHMAQYRNICRELMLSDTDAQIMCVLDADLAGWSIQGIMHSLSLQEHWDACASNGLRRDGQKWHQCDAWAYRKKDWKEIPFSKVKDLVFQRGEALVPVKSAFGGMALYTRESYEKASYTGGDCEHVTFHRKLNSRVVVNPSQIVVYRW